MSDKIKEEIMKQLSANVIRAVRYTTWVANVMPVPKKDGKTKFCVDYRDLIKILMDEDDAEKTTFTTPWEYESCIMGLKMDIDLDVHELLVMGDSHLIIRQDQGEWETRDIKLIPYRQCVQDLSRRFKSIEFRYIPMFHNELADALATLASILPYPDNTHIDPLEIQVRNQHGYCNTIETEPDGEPWYHDIKRFQKTREYLKHAKGDQKRTIRRLTNGFFLNGEILYKSTPDLNLLRCIGAIEAEQIMSEVHSG
uniref:Uncharacterized protein LOC104230463 n=1 Tax=Nicotiana sylvestris TaxID=4096 RepID=A0A1U7WWA1_NICSY